MVTFSWLENVKLVNFVVFSCFTMYNNFSFLNWLIIKIAVLITDIIILLQCFLDDKSL